MMNMEEHKHRGKEVTIVGHEEGSSKSHIKRKKDAKKNGTRKPS